MTTTPDTTKRTPTDTAAIIRRAEAGAAFARVRRRIDQADRDLRQRRIKVSNRALYILPRPLPEPPQQPS